MRWKYKLHARNPRDLNGAKWTVGIDEGKITLLARKGHEAKLARIALVKDVLDDPDGIIGGWSRPDRGDCYVYFGTPNRDFRSTTIETPAPPEKMFLVFVLSDGTIDDWNWRLVDSNNPNLPEGLVRGEGEDGLDQRGELIWTRQT